MNDKPTPWWKPRSSQIGPEGNTFSSWKKLGKADKAAVLLFEEIQALLADSDWMDCIEAIVEATTDVDPDDLEKWEKTYEHVEKYILTRACRALINNAEDRPDRVAHLAFERSTEKAGQT